MSKFLSLAALSRLGPQSHASGIPLDPKAVT